MFLYRLSIAERTPIERVNMVLNEPTITCCSCRDGGRGRTQCACKFLRTIF